LYERPASVGLDSIFSICLKSSKDFASLVVPSAIYDKNPNSTSTTSCNENGPVQARLFEPKAHHRAAEFGQEFSA